MDEMKVIDWNELSRRGLLMRINREIMHPLGLAICRIPETGVSPRAIVSPDGPFVFVDDVRLSPSGKP
jgi:hypothetical protein